MTMSNREKDEMIAYIESILQIPRLDILGVQEQVNVLNGTFTVEDLEGRADLNLGEISSILVYFSLFNYTDAYIKRDGELVRPDKDKLNEDEDLIFRKTRERD